LWVPLQMIMIAMSSNMIEETYMNINKRFPTAVQSGRKLTIVWNIPDVYFMRRWICRTCPHINSSSQVNHAVEKLTSSEPLSIRAIRHSMPRDLADGIIESMSRFQFCF
jgi:hypothetical protein